MISSFRLDHFSRPETLASVRPHLLRKFLSPYEIYLSSRQFDLENLDKEENADQLIHLSGVLLNPSTEIPHELVDALFCVHEVAIEANTDLLEMTIRNEKVKHEENANLLEIALTIWMANPEALKRIHYRQFITRVRSFEYFSRKDSSAGNFELNSESLRQIECSLAFYFKKKNRGYGCRIHYYPKDTEHWFLVSHGELFRRESTWEEGKAGTISFRPEKYDLVVYNSITEELRINASSESLREHYRKQFGFYLFGRENHFPGKSKYTLEPLLRDRESALFTGDVNGIDWVRLSEISYAIEDEAQEIRIHKAPDIFRALEHHDYELSNDLRLLKASFKIKFQKHTKPRTLTIKPSNVALYTRDGDGQIVEEWLLRRGFIRKGNAGGHEQLEHVLEIG